MLPTTRYWPKESIEISSAWNNRGELRPAFFRDKAQPGNYHMYLCTYNYTARAARIYYEIISWRGNGTPTFRWFQPTWKVIETHLIGNEYPPMELFAFS